MLGGAELGGCDDVIMGDVVVAVSNDLLGIIGESGKEGHAQTVKHRGGNWGD